MAQQEQPLSQVVPLLVAALICDVAVTDPSTGKVSLIGIFSSINVGTFPTQRAMSLYLKTVDAEGRYEFEVRYVKRATGEVLAQAQGELMARDRLKASDLSIGFPPLPIPTEGRYEFQIWANSMFLGTAFVDAVPRTAPGRREEGPHGN